MNRKHAFLLIAVGVLAAATTWAFPGDHGAQEAEPRTAVTSGPPPIGPGGAYLRGAHWFGKGWAVNFWNTRLLDRAKEDFATLREDGFNTVVLVIPWPGFSPSPTDGELDAERARRLAALVDLAGDAGLNVVLRLGYAWDSSVAMSGRWLVRLWFEEAVRQAWLRHIAGIWELVGSRPHVRFAFISWEDLWAIEGVGNAAPAKRLALAVQSGYREWLRGSRSLEEVSRRYGVRFGSWEEVPVPARTEPAFGLFFEFIDHAWIERFFKPAQAVFPTLSMEVRIDSDPVWSAPGELAYWHSHEAAWDLPGAPWTTVYWAPAMGGENRGEVLSPETAVERLEYQMRRLRQVTGDRPIFIDQFLVEDYTPGFEMNGRLERDAVDDFLEQAEPVLRSLTHGYGLWTWRDYAHNAVASPDFSNLAGNWDGARPDRDGKAPYAFDAGERLERAFGIHEFHAPGGPERAELCVTGVADGDPAPDLRVLAGSRRSGTEVDVSGSGRACLDLAVAGETTVALEAMVDLELFDVSFSGFTQPTGIRDIEGRAKPIAAAWRDLNEALSVPRPEPFRLYDDGWMGKTFSDDLRAPGGGAAAVLQFKTHLPRDWPFQPRLTVLVNGEAIAEVPCADDQTHALSISRQQLVEGSQAITLTADRTYRPEGDERRLGCLVEGLGWE